MEQGNIAWMLVSSALVLFMTPGLALFYAGLARSKNASATIMHSLMSMGIIGVVWVLWGYTIAFGPSVGGLFGDFSLFGLSGVSAEVGPEGGIPPLLFMMFQGMFAIIAPAILTGAFAERMKFSAYVLFMILWVTLVYAPVAHWVWAEGGWILELGALDFAGGNVVHITSGVGALAAALIVGRRMGFGTEPMESHNVPMVVLGTGMLWFGWFGFNAGSALAADSTAVNAFVVTNTAAAAGAIGWAAIHMAKRRQAVRHRRGFRRSRRPSGDNPRCGLCRPNARRHHRDCGRCPLRHRRALPRQTQPGRRTVRMGSAWNRWHLGRHRNWLVRGYWLRRIGHTPYPADWHPAYLHRCKLGVGVRSYGYYPARAEIHHRLARIREQRGDWSRPRRARRTRLQVLAFPVRQEKSLPH